MDGCEHARDLILGSEADALSPAEREELDTHLADCAECRAAASSLDDDVQTLRALGEARLEASEGRREAFLDALNRQPVRPKSSRRDAKRRRPKRAQRNWLHYALPALAAAAAIILYVGLPGDATHVTVPETRDVATTDVQDRDLTPVLVSEVSADEVVSVEPRGEAFPEPGSVALAENAEPLSEIPADRLEGAPQPLTPEVAVAETPEPTRAEAAEAAATDHRPLVELALSRTVTESLAAGAMDTISLTVGGVALKGSIKSADERSIRFIAAQGGFEVAVPWQRLDDTELLELSRRYMKSYTLDERVAVARFCTERELLNDAREELEAIASAYEDAAAHDGVIAAAFALEERERALRADGDEALAAQADARPALARASLATAWNGAPSMGSVAYSPASAPRTGFYQDTLKVPYTDIEIISYALDAPQVLPKTRSLGLVVTFHGAGPATPGSETGMIWLPKIASEGDPSQQMVVIGGRAKRGHWTAADDEPMTKLIDWVISTYPIDPRRVVFLGYSSGAWMARRYGMDRRDIAAGIVSIAGSYGKRQAAEGIAYVAPFEGVIAAPSVYLVHGQADIWADVSSARKEAGELSELGYQCVLQEMPGLDHGNILADERMRPLWHDLGAWMGSLRHGSGRLFDEDIAFLKEAATRDEADLWSDAKAIAEIKRVGGFQAGKLVRNGLASDSPAIRSAAVALCAEAYFGKSVVGDLVTLLSDNDTDVRMAAYRSVAVMAGRGDRRSQAAMAKLILDPRLDTAERVLGIAAIAEALRIQALGRIQDGTLLEPLIVLLRDDDDELRLAAREGLEYLIAEGPKAEEDDGKPESRRRIWKKWAAWYAKEYGAGVSQ